VIRVLTATGAELGELETTSGGLLVLGGGVIPFFTGTALEGDDFAHLNYSFVWPATSAGKQRAQLRHAATQGLMAPAAKILIVVTESERSGHALTRSIIHEIRRLAKSRRGRRGGAFAPPEYLRG
jgi:hypothetical protein